MDEDFLTLLEEVGYVGVGRIGLESLAVFAEKDVCEVIENAASLADIEKCVAGKPDIDERGLHPGQDAIDAALVEVADHRRCAMPLRDDLAR